MANQSDFVRLSIYSKKDKSSLEYDMPSYAKDFRNFVNNALKSSLPKDAFYQIAELPPDKTGRRRWDIYLHKDNSDLAHTSMSTLSSKLLYKGGGEKYHITQARPVSEEQSKVLRAEEKALQNEQKESLRFNRGTLLKIVGALTALTDIARRILSSVISFSQQTAKDMINSGNLGMSYEAVRKYRHIETIHGLSENTITDSLADIQKAFGNITSLDEKALESLALIMGGKIQEMVEMGLGSSNPEAVLGAILDAFNAKANAGYNSLGQYVGEAQARRELYSYLNKIFPKVADIFGTMQEEQHNINSLFRNQADTWAKWTDVIPTKRGNHIPAEYNIPATVSQQWGIVQNIFDQIKEGIYVTLAPEILALLRKIADLRFGMSESENRERNEENRQANNEFLERAKVQLEALQGDNLTEAERQRKMALEYYINDVEKANKGNIKGNIRYAVPTPDEIVVKGQKLAETRLTKSTWKQEVEYSPALRETVEAYIDKDKLDKFISSYKQERLAGARQEANKRIKEEEKNRRDEYEQKIAEEVEDKVLNDKSSPYYLDKLARKNLFTLGSHKTVAEVEARYKNDMMSRYDKDGVNLWYKWNTLSNVYAKEKFAVEHGYAYWGNTVTKTGAKAKTNTDTQNLSDYEKQQIYKAEVANISAELEEEAYVEAYKKWWDKLAKHLLRALQEEAREKAQEGTPLYDLDILQSEYGAHLEGLPKKIAEETGKSTYTGEGGIISYTSEDNKVITHRIIFDLNNNGKPEASDVPLSQYKTNRHSDTGTIVDRVEIRDGKLLYGTAEGLPASKGK